MDTATATATAKPKVVMLQELIPLWRSEPTLVIGGGEWDSPGWLNIHQDGGRITLEPSKTGMLFRLEAVGDQNKRRLQLDKRGKPLGPPWAVENEFLLSEGFPLPEIENLTPVSLFREVDADGVDYDLIATLRVKSDGRFEVGIKQPYSGEDAQVIKTNSRVEPGVLQKIRTEAPDNNTLRVWHQGKLVAEAPVPPRLKKDGTPKPLCLRQANCNAMYGTGIPTGAVMYGVRAEIQIRDESG